MSAEYPDQERLTPAEADQNRQEFDHVTRGLERGIRVRKAINWIVHAIERQGMRSILQHGGELTPEQIEQYNRFGSRDSQ